MIAVSIDIPVNTAGPSLRRVQEFLNSPSVQNLVGYESQRTVRQHLQDMDDTRPNKMGGNRTHYYGSARRSTIYRVEGNAVEVAIQQVGMRLHYYGGMVMAGKGISAATGRPTKYLTIPARAEAHGKRASDFPDLVVVWGRRGPVGLALGEPQATTSGPVLTKRSRKGLKPGLMMFWLVPQVSIAPDPTVLPPSDTVVRNVNDRLKSAIARRFAGEIDEPLPPQP